MTYTPILNAEVDAESPITDLLLTRLRDNPIAIAAGDSGAPRIQFAALDAWFSTLGSVGTYAFCRKASGTLGEGATISGSSLSFAYITDTGDVQFGGTKPSGTWRNMSFAMPFSARTGIFLRIS